MGLKAGEGRRGVCKSDGISGNFGGVGSDLGPSGAVRMKIVSLCQRTAEWVYDQSVFEQKGDSGLSPTRQEHWEGDGCCGTTRNIGVHRG